MKMKKKLSLMIVCVFALSVLLPAATAFAYDAPKQKGYISSGIVYEGVLDKNSSGDSIPDEYTLMVERNSIVRLQAYTTGTNFTLDVDSPENPDIAPETYSVIKGDACTKVNSYDMSAPVTYNTSGMGVTSDKRNTSPYTEVFTNLIDGTYKIRISGGPNYKFKVIIDPLMFENDSITNSNFTRETAMRVEMNQPQDGNLMSNGILNGKYYSTDTDRISNDFYKFYINRPGFYKLTLISDGFFQGVGEIIDENGSFLTNGTIDGGLSFNGGVTKNVVGTFEQHKAAAGTTFVSEFEAKTSGMFLFQVRKKAFTAGSYQFIVNTTAPGVSTTIPTVIPTPTLTPTPTPPSINDNGINETGNNGALLVKKLIPGKSKVYLKIGKTTTNKIIAVLEDGTRKDVSGEVSLSSSGKAVTVYKKTMIKALRKGTARITAKYGNVTTSYIVVVK